MKIKTIFEQSEPRQKFVYILQQMTKEKSLIAFASRSAIMTYLESRGGLVYIHKAKRPQELTNYAKLRRELMRFPLLQITLVPPGATLLTHNEPYLIYQLPIIKRL